MTDTPRTDAAVKWISGHEIITDWSSRGGDQSVTSADFARTLERELAAMTEERDALRADFAALQYAIVGNTGASAILEAERLRADFWRLWFLTEDHDSLDTREKRNQILRRMPVMSYSAACAAIDAAIAASKDKP